MPETLPARSSSSRSLRRALSLLALLLVPVASLASGENVSSPRITGVWVPATNGARVNVVGEGFGEHTLQLMSSAGPSGWIELNEKGTDLRSLEDAPGWDVGEASEPSPPVISDQQSYSMDHSVLGRVDTDSLGNWQSVLRYRHGESFDYIYATWWIYWDPIRVSRHRHTQWKMWRLNHNGTVVDQTGQLLVTSRYEADGSVHTYQALLHCTLDCGDRVYSECWEHAAPDPWYASLFDDPPNYRYLNRAGAIDWDSVMPTPRQWNRVELIVRRSGVDQHDGTLEVWITKPDRGRIFVDRQSGLLSRVSATDCRNPSDPWQYFQFQNYWDDDGSAQAELFTGERADFFYDDIYFQFGTAARVELGNAPNYASCTRLDVQTPLAWSPSSIDVEINHGSFSAGEELFLFVVDDSGVASPGFPITLH